MLPHFDIVAEHCRMLENALDEAVQDSASGVLDAEALQLKPHLLFCLFENMQQLISALVEVVGPSRDDFRCISDFIDEVYEAITKIHIAFKLRRISPSSDDEYQQDKELLDAVVIAIRPAIAYFKKNCVE